MTKLSIIVPVYNVENYVKECLESLLNQTLNDIEILVIDDGSTDNSIAIIEKIDDSRIKIFHKENGGLSSARNYGLKEATGEYVSFFDSDDFIDGKDSFKKLYEKAKSENLDIISGIFSWYYSKGNIKKETRYESLANEGVISGKEYLKKSLSCKGYIAVVCTQLYRREFLIRNNLMFKEGIYHEDEHFTPRALLKAKKVLIDPLNFYMYRQREGSIMSKPKNIKRANDIFSICEDLSKEIDKESDKDLKREFRSYIVDLVLQYSYIFKLKDVQSPLKRKYSGEELNKNVRVKLKLFNINERIYYIFQNLIFLVKEKKV